MLSLKLKIKLLGFASGILISYVLFGLLQEKIFRGTYGEEAEKFTYSVAFVAIQCIVCTLFAKGVMLVQGQQENETHQKYFGSIAVCYVTSMVTAIMALRYLPYPTQVIGKAAKPIPVMILGVLFGRKSYTAQKYLFVLMIVIGVAMFMLKENYARKDEDYTTGVVLIVFSLLMDGMTGATQDRMRAYSRPSAMNFMYYVNGWSAVFLISVLAITGEGRDAILFSRKHPIVTCHLSLAILCGTMGQVFVTAIITNFGSLPLSLATTTRKFFTVLLSVIVYGNKLIMRQWLAAGLIFIALLLDSVFSRKLRPKNENSQKDEGAERRPEASENYLQDITGVTKKTPEERTSFDVNM